MMKMERLRISAMIMALVACLCAKAQDLQLVTLQHGDKMTAYYGADAFKSAMAAAEKGDLITLSGGTFNAAKIDKAVTIQGAGYVQRISENRYMTRILGDCDIELGEGATGLLVEGIWSNNTFNVKTDAKLATFKRCRIQNLTFTGKTSNCLILQCRIYEFHPDAHSVNLLVQNSVVDRLGGNAADAQLCFENCVFPFSGGSSSNAGRPNPTVTYKNCIVRAPSSNPLCIAYNNLWDSEHNGQDFNTTESQNNTKVYIRNVFNEAEGWEQSLTLTEDAAKKYLGLDGTQVGIYGGVNGFTDVPSNPRITSKTVAPQSDANGKLSVKITVEAQKN